MASLNEFGPDAGFHPPGSLLLRTYYFHHQSDDHILAGTVDGSRLTVLGSPFWIHILVRRSRFASLTRFERRAVGIATWSPT